MKQIIFEKQLPTPMYEGLSRVNGTDAIALKLLIMYKEDFDNINNNILLVYPANFMKIGHKIKDIH